LAKLRGAKVIAIASRTKAEAVLQHGADVVVARDSDDFAADLKRSTGYRGVDVVLDVVGGELTKVLWHSLDRAGRYVTSGAIGGAQAVVDLRELIYKDLEMYGVTFPEAEALQNLIRYIAEGQLKPVIDQVFPLRALAEAQAQFATRRHVGKIVIDMITG
jgi:NADPH:quinone reductase-like Zn-dependent oxidoreductase